MRRWKRKEYNRRKKEKLGKERKRGAEGKRKEESEKWKQGANRKRKGCEYLTTKESRETDSSIRCGISD